jgi:hypothetical protein
LLHQECYERGRDGTKREGHCGPGDGRAQSGPTANIN